MAEDADLLALGTRAGLPDALQILREAFPRMEWQGHENFGELVQFWMERHVMFRQIVAALREDAQARDGGALAPDAHARRLMRLGGLLIRDLHMHHNVEDHHYFPQLIGLVPALDSGFDLLEADHAAIDPMLEQLTGDMNAILKGSGSAAELEAALARFETLLDRHLTDEEDLIVPVILKSGFTG